MTIVLVLAFGLLVASAMPDAGAAEPPAGGLVSSVANFDRTEGSFSVSDDGAAQYTMPLWVPKGRGKVAPELALSYDSGGANGLLGVGWTMSGLSTIAPCARTIAQDGATGGVNYDSSDVFCLDGSRLVPVSAAGATEREYRTEQESFAKIVAYGMQDGVPDSFKVWAKDGRISSYGATANARMQAFRLQAGSEPNTLVKASTLRVTVAWALDRVEDRNGNAMTVEYERVEGTAAQLWHLESRPKVIKYAPNREVRFGYEDRVHDVLEGFGRGVHTREPKRLSRVEMWAGPSGTDSVPVRSYRLGYTNASTTQRSLLNSVVECDGNGVGTCKRPQTFDWSMGSFEFDEINLTGVTDVGRYRPVGLPTVEVDNRVIVGDIDGDGRDDLLYPDSRTVVQVGQRQKWYVRLNTGAGFGAATPAGFEPPTFQCGTPDDTDSCYPAEARVRQIDADMDGRMDVAVWSPLSPGLNKWRLFVSNGTKFVPYAQELETVGESGNDPNPVYFGDVDGNGTPDYVTAPFAPASGDNGPISGPWTYRLNTGAAGAARFGPFVGTGRSAPPFPNQNKMVDVNADGRMDLVNDSGVSVGWGLGASGVAEARRYDGAPYGSGAADVNGDGLEDAVDPFTMERATTLDFGLVRASLNSGNGFGPKSASPTNFWEPRVCCGTAPPPNGEPSFIDHGYDRGVRYADFTGDGNDDVLVFHGGEPSGGGDVKNGVQLFTWRDGTFERVQLGPSGLAAGDWGPDGFVPSQVLDFDGDGTLDIVHVQGSCKPDCNLRVLKRRGGVPDRLTGIGDRVVRERIDIDYAHLGNRSVHTPGTCTYPVRCVNTGGTVVMRHQISTFAGADEATFDQYSHSYVGARQDLQGRGWLGFASHTVIRASTGETTVTEFDNVARDAGTKAYAFAFMPKKVTVTVTDDPSAPVTIARESQRTTVTEPFIRRYSSGTYSVEPKTVTETDREHAVGGGWTVLRERVTDNAFDNFGNRAKVETATTNGRKLTEDPTFSNDTEAWLIGLPTRMLTSGCTAANVCTTRESTFDYDDAGNLTKTVVQPNQPALKLTTDTEYGTYGIVKSITRTDNSGLARKDVFEYADADKVHPTATINAAGHKTTIVTDSGLGVPIKTTDPNGFVTTMQYDYFGQLRATYRADGSFERIDHTVNTSSQTTTTTVAGGGKTEVVTDRLGRERQRAVLAFNGAMARVYTTYDELSRVWTVSRPARAGDALQSTITRYDNRGRIRTVTAPDDAVVATTYLNRETHTVDAKGVESYTVATVDGDVESSYQDDPNATAWLRTRFEYGSFGDTTKITAPDGTVQSMHYDVLGRRDQLTDPSAGATSTGYNAFGEIVSETDGNNVTTTHVRDALGRIKTSTSPDGTLTNVWDTAANGKGQLAKATSADGTVTAHTYNALSQQTATKWTIDGTSYDIDYGYDPNTGRQTSLKYPQIPGNNGRLTINYTYNASGYLKTIKDAATDGDTYWTAEDRNAAGQLTKERFANGVITENTYQPQTGLLDILTITGPGSTGVLGKVDYGYDLNRNVDNRNDLLNHRWEKYGHDTLNRVKSWQTFNNGPNQPWMNASYTYDKVGFLKSETFKAQGVDTTTTYTNEPNGARPHAMTKRNNIAYAYDDAGRQTSGAGRTIDYNQAGLPKKLTWGQGQETTFKYDAAGARVFKRDATSSVVYVPGLFERRAGSTDIQSLHNIVVDGRVVAQVNKIQTSPTGPASTQTWYVHGDGQGSTMLVTNANGTSSGGQDGFLADLYYDPFGRRIDANYLPLGNQGHGGPRQGYTGHEHDDEYGLINMKGRIYDPEARRFLTPDPLIENPFNSQTLNRYAYVQNNPTTYTDPTGYAPQRSASYWDRPPQSFDARAEGVSKAIIYRLSNGTIVILLFRNTGSVNGKAATSAASDDDAGKKASITTGAGGRPSFTPDNVADYLEAMAGRKAERHKVDKARFLEYFKSRILYGKSEDDLRVFVGRLEARGCWEEGSIGGQQLEAAKVALYGVENKQDSKQPVIDKEGRASWGLGAYVYTKAEMQQIQRATTIKAALSVLTAPPGHGTGNVASGYRFWLTGDPSDAAFFGAMFNSAGALAGMARGVDYHVNDGINNRPPKPLQPDPLKNY